MTFSSLFTGSSSLSVFARGVLYTKWEGHIYKAAIKTIGRTTFKKNGNKKPSKEIQKLRKEKTVCRTDFEKEENHQQKGDKLRKYIQ